MKDPRFKGALKTCLSVLLVGCLSLSALAGCRNNSSSTSAGDKKHVTLSMLMFGNFRGFDEVEKEFEKETKNTLNTSLKITSVEQASYKNKLQLSISSGDNYDLVFDAPWVSIATLSKQGAYIPLDKYFNSTQYPALKKNFSKDYLDANEYFGHIYGVPFTQSYNDLTGYFVRTDLMKKYGYTSIDNDDQYKKFCDDVLAGEKSLVPIEVNGARGLYHAMSDLYQPTVKNFAGAGVPNVMLYVWLSNDNKKVVTSFAMGAPDSEYANLPSPYNKDFFPAEYSAYHNWNKYIEPDAVVVTASDANSAFTSGKAASLEGDLSNYETLKTSLQSSVPGADLYFYPSDSAQREMKSGAMATSYQASNYLCIPKTSTNADRSMEFLNWIFSSKANHDLLELGIPGKNWVAVGDNEYKLPSGVNANSNYSIPGYELTWNPNFVRLPSDLTDQVRKYYQYEENAKSYYKNPLAGYTFDPTNVKTQVASLTTIYTSIQRPLLNGVYADPSSVLTKYYQDCEKAGLEDVKKEALKQIQAFLDKTYGGGSSSSK